MASRALKQASAPAVKNSKLPKMGAYCAPDSVPHIGNSQQAKGGNKASKTMPANSVALKRK